MTFFSVTPNFVLLACREFPQLEEVDQEEKISCRDEHRSSGKTGGEGQKDPSPQLMLANCHVGKGQL